MNSMFLVLLCLFALCVCDYSVQWGTSTSDFGSGIAIADDNSVFVTGETTGALDGNSHASSTPNGNVGNSFLTRFSPGGAKIWTREWGTTSGTAGKAVTVDSGGKVFVCGFTAGALDGQTSAGNTDIFLTKFSFDGAKVWTRQWGSSRHDYGYGVAIGENNNVYVVGSWDFSGGISPHDIFLSKYSTDGSQLWHKVFGSSDRDEGYDVAIDHDIYLTGYAKGSLDGIATGGAFLNKWLPNGTMVWNRQWGGSSSIGYAVAVDTRREVYVTGIISASAANVFVKRYSTNGTDQWTRQLTTDGQDYGQGIVVDVEDNIYITGFATGSLDGNVYAGSQDIFLAQYSSSGIKNWVKQWGTTENDRGESVAVNSHGVAFVTGYTVGALVGSNIGNSDIFLSSISSTNCAPGELRGTLKSSPDVSVENGKTCPHCSPGKFSNTSNAVSCIQCPDGASNFIYGATNCNETFTFISSVEPQAGPSYGNTAVTFIGGNINSTQRPVFQFGNTKITAPACTWQSSTKINCTTPAFPFNANVSVYIESTTTSPLYVAPTFSYYSNNYTAMELDSGPTTGGTTVVVQTEYVSTRQPNKVKCRFGSANPVTATAMTSTSVTCATPNLGSAGNRDVYLTMNNQQYDLVQGGAFIAYSTTLSAIAPQSGAKTGGTVVTLSGSGFVDGRDTPTVSINPNSGSAKVVNGAFVGSTVVGTTINFNDVPTITAGTTMSSTVTLAPNGQQYLGSSTTFKLYEEHGLSSVSPSTAPTSASGITITLSPDGGKSFANTGSEIRVRFRPSDGSINTMTGTFVSSSSITATIPSMGAVGRGDVSVALNGQQWSPWQELTLFRVDSISPQWGPTTGGTMVTVIGNGFNNTGGNLKCKFGSTTPVVVTYISSSEVRCTSPSLTAAGHVVSVTTNGNDYSTTTGASVTLTASTMPVPSGVTPSPIPAPLGTVTVTVAGSGFVNTGQIRVKFGSLVSTGTFVSSTQITCTAPAQAAGSYPVTVSLNSGLQYSGSNSVSLVTSNPSVSSILPVSGPQNGGTKLTITGTGFINTNVLGSMRVRFGGSQDVNVISASQTQIVVTTPALNVNLPTTSSTQDWTVEVSTNAGFTFTTNGKILTIYQNSATNFNETIPSYAISSGETVIQLTGTIPSSGSTPGIRLSDGNGWTSSSITASHSSGRIQFTAPQYQGNANLPASLQVHVALNGLQFFDTQQTITAYAAPTITAVDPLRKTPGENIIVTITGTGFIDTGSVRIKLGTVVFAALSVSSTSITFRSNTDHARGEYRLEVSLDGGQHYSISAAGTTFNVLPEPLACPTNTESYIPTPVTIEDCQCKVDFYSPTGKAGVVCDPCPPNAKCNGRLSQPVAQPGFFNTGSGNDFQFTRCGVAAACLGGNSTSACATGYQGVMCGSCVKGFYKLGDTCQQCQEGSGGTIVLIIILFILYLFFVKRQVRAASKSTGKVAALAITHLQVMSTFSEYRLKWPSSVQTVLNLFSIANFNMDTAAPECSLTDEWTYESRFWWTLMLPLIVIGGLLLRVLGQFIRAQWVRNNGERFKANRPSFCAEPDTSLPKWKFVFDLMRYNLSTMFTEAELVDQETLRHLLNEILFTMGLLYITLCNRVLEVFDCTEIRTGYQVMDVVPDEQCWVEGGMHARLVGPASVFLLIYVIGIPLTFFLVMLSGRKDEKRNQEAFQQKYSTLFNKYADRYFWFEGIVMIRKAAVVAVKLFATTLPALQGLMGLIVLGSATLIQNTYNPYKTSPQNRLEIILLVESLLLLLAGMIFVTEDGVNDDTREGWENLTIVIAVSVLVVCVYYVARDVWNSVNEAKNAKKRSVSKSDAMDGFMTTVGALVKPDYQGKLREIADTKLNNSRLKMLTKAVQAAKDREQNDYEQELGAVHDAAHTSLKETQITALITLLANPSAQSATNDELKKLIIELGSNDNTLKRRLSTVSNRLSRSMSGGKEGIELSDLKVNKMDDEE